MGILKFPGSDERSTKPIGYEEFAKGIESKQVGELVQNEMDRMFHMGPHSRERISVKRPKVQRLESPAFDYGAMQPHPANPKILAVHENFPQSLAENGVNRHVALILASSSTIAFSSIANWINGLGQNSKVSLANLSSHRHMLPQFPRLWHVESYNPSFERQNVHVITHRMAARVALNIVELEDIDLVTPPPYPVHIAALVDPFNNAQMRELRSTTETHS